MPSTLAPVNVLRLSDLIILPDNYRELIRKQVVPEHKFSAQALLNEVNYFTGGEVHRTFLHEVDVGAQEIYDDKPIAGFEQLGDSLKGKLARFLQTVMGLQVENAAGKNNIKLANWTFARIDYRKHSVLEVLCTITDEFLNYINTRIGE